MSRKKPEVIEPIGDLAAANAALGEIAGLQRRLAGIEQGMNEAIDHAKKAAEAEAAPLAARLKALEGGLQAFAALGKGALFADRRSVELAHGQFGFRRATALKTAAKVTWDMVLGKLRELGQGCIRLKEEVDKQALGEWTDERLELVGVRRVETDTFWYEVAAEDLKAEQAA